MSVLRSRWPVVLLSLACAVVLYALYAPGYWVFDDWLYFSLARHFGPSSSTWLGSVYFQHWAPAHRLGMSLATETGASFDLVVGLTIAALCATGPLLAGMLDVLFGRHRLHLLAVAFYLLSMFFVSPLNWWSAGLQMVPTAVGGAAALWAYLHWRSDRRDRWLVVVALGVSLGLLFYIRPLLVPVYVVLVRMLLLERELTPRRLWAVIVDERRAAVALLVPCVVYGVHYLGLSAGDDATGQYNAASDYLEFFAIAWARVLVPGLLGFRVQPGDVATGFQTAVVVAGQVLLLGFIALTIVRRRSAWRAWALFLAATLVNLLIIAIPRVPPFGPGIAYSPRYFTDVALLFPIAVLAAWRGAPAVRDTEVVRRLRLDGPVVPALAAVAVVAYVAASLGTARTLNGEWFGTANRSWVEHLEGSVEPLEAARTPVVVADHQTPDYVVYKDYPPYDRLSSFFGVVGLDVQVDGPLDGRRLMAVGPDGTTGPAAFAPLSGTPALAGLRDGTVLMAPGTVSRRAGAACLAAPATAPGYISYTPRTPVRAPADAPELYLRIGARVASPTQLLLRTAPPGGPLPVGTDLAATLRPGSTASLAWVHARAGASVRMDVPPGTEVCLSSIALGTVLPTRTTP